MTLTVQISFFFQSPTRVLGASLFKKLHDSEFIQHLLALARIFLFAAHKSSRHWGVK